MSKKFKYILVTIVFTILISIFIIPKNKEPNKILLLGDNGNIKPYLEEEFNIKGIYENIDNSFCYYNMKSEDLLYYISNNASNDKVNFNDSLKESKVVFISIGYADILSRLTISRYEKRISYDKEALEVAYAIFEQNLFHIVEHIRLINDDVIVLLSCYDDSFYFLEENDENHKIIETLNKIIKDISVLFDVNSIELLLNDVKYYNDEFSFFPNEYGERKKAKILSDKIVALLENI